MSANKNTLADRVEKAKAAALFAAIVRSDTKGRPVVVIAPGSEAKSYSVEIMRNGHIETRCTQAHPSRGAACKGNSGKTVCYHSIAALIVAAEWMNKRVSFCAIEGDARKLARTGGEVFSVKSAQVVSPFDSTLWMVVRDDNDDKPSEGPSLLDAPSVLDTPAEQRNSSEQALAEIVQGSALKLNLPDERGLVEINTQHAGQSGSAYTQADWQLAQQWADAANMAAEEVWAERCNEYILDGTDDRPARPATLQAASFIEDARAQRQERSAAAKLALYGE